MIPPASAHHYAVGVKELIGLPPAVIADRFNLSGNDGAARLFAGSPSNGLMGGGFLYTNQDSISLGTVCGLGDIAHATKSVPQMLEDFKQHPTIRPLIAGVNCWNIRRIWCQKAARQWCLNWSMMV